VKLSDVHFARLSHGQNRPERKNSYPHPRGSLTMCVLIKDLRRSGVQVCANKRLSSKNAWQAASLQTRFQSLTGRQSHIVRLSDLFEELLCSKNV
jgi:hypothetical protein